jgi:hypothetical protein
MLSARCFIRELHAACAAGLTASLSGRAGWSTKTTDRRARAGDLTIELRSFHIEMVDNACLENQAAKFTFFGI